MRLMIEKMHHGSGKVHVFGLLIEQAHVMQPLRQRVPLQPQRPLLNLPICFAPCLMKRIEISE